MTRNRRVRKPPVLGPDGLPPPLRWRPTLDVKTLLSTVGLAVGTCVLLQQFGLLLLTTRVLLEAVAVSLAAAVVLPSLGRLVGVLLGNRLLRRERARRAAEAEA